MTSSYVRNPGRAGRYVRRMTVFLLVLVCASTLLSWLLWCGLVHEDPPGEDWPLAALLLFLLLALPVAGVSFLSGARVGGSYPLRLWP